MAVKTSGPRPGRAIAGLLVVAVLAVIVSWSLRAPSLPPWPDPPEPNAYLDLLQIAAELRQAEEQPASSTSDSTNAPAPPPPELIHRLRQTVHRPGAVPSQPSTEYLEVHLAELGEFKQASVALVTVARLELAEGRTNGAAEISLDLFRLAALLSRHALVIDRLVALSIEAQGIELLGTCAAGLSPEELRAASTTLEALDPPLSDWQAVVDLETQFSDRITPRAARLALRLQGLFGQYPLRRGLDQFVARVKPVVAERRTLILRLAALRFERETGRVPDSASELVPRYLRAIPLDPDTGEPLLLPPPPVAAQIAP
jgi:hypothetical protein